jgi:hypothetical protein
MATQNQATAVLPAALAARVEALPPILSVQQLSIFFEKKVGTVRKQIERGVFPVRIRQIDGGEQFATLYDLIQFLVDGEPQPQPQLVRRAARNPYGKKGKVGRKTNEQKAAEARTTQQSGGAK